MFSKMLFSDGSHHSIGLDHGEHLQQEIATNLMAFWKSVGSLGYDRHAVIRTATRNEALLSPDILEEIAGIAKGSKKVSCSRTRRLLTKKSSSASKSWRGWVSLTPNWNPSGRQHAPASQGGARCQKRGLGRGSDDSNLEWKGPTVCRHLIIEEGGKDLMTLCVKGVRS